jgi:hypothetical protein
MAGGWETEACILAWAEKEGWEWKRVIKKQQRSRRGAGWPARWINHFQIFSCQTRQADRMGDSVQRLHRNHWNYTYSHPYQAQVPPELFVSTNMVNETIYVYQGTTYKYTWNYTLHTRRPRPPFCNRLKFVHETVYTVHNVPKKFMPIFQISRIFSWAGYYISKKYQKVFKIT